jgi:PPOX class probable F420-dependent enzyme
MTESTTADQSGLLDLFAQLRQGILITLKQDGRPQSSVVGHAFDPATRTLRISVTDDRAKTRNLRRDPRASYLYGWAGPR